MTRRIGTLGGPLSWLAVAAVATLALPLAGATRSVWIVQTNSAGDNVHFIDAATNKIVAEVGGIERAHGAAASPDGNWVYVSNEADTTVDVVNVKSLKVTKKIPLTGHPNNIAITPDGRKVYVAIAQAPGALDVIDAGSQAKARTISVHGGVHNVYVTPDGKYAVAGMIGARNMTVVDTATDMPVWAHYFDLGVRPIGFDTNPDGSTRQAYVQLTNFNGFAVVDFATRKEVARVKYPDMSKEMQTPGHGGNTAHGIGVTPDNRYLVATSSLDSTVYVYSLPDVKLMGSARIGHSPNWVTITPDSRFAYISLSGANSVAVLDIKAVKVVTEIKTGGQVPKRNTTIVVTQ
jgi:YVTN family beta-propeller protein